MKCIDRRKGELLIALLLPATAAPSAAQQEERITPPTAALSLSTSARIDHPWLARDNPAALTSVEGIIVLGSFTPPPLGIAGLHEGGTLVALPVDTTLALGLAIDGVRLRGYGETTIAATVAWSPDPAARFGVTVATDHLAIEGYGSAVAPSFDLGVLLLPSPGIRFGGTLRTPIGSWGDRIALRRRLTMGFAFDIERSTVLSVDARHEIGRPVGASVGLSTSLDPALTLRAGFGHGPTMISLGMTLDCDGIIADYGGSYIVPIGFRHLFGVGVRL